MANGTSGGARIAGLAISAVVVVFLAADGLAGLLSPSTLAGPMQETGFPPAMLWAVSGAALLAAIVYAIPRTAVLGAILVTAFCGGAIATHVRVGTVAAPPQVICFLVAVAAWGGLWLRDPRVRALLP